MRTAISSSRSLCWRRARTRTTSVRASRRFISITWVRKPNRGDDDDGDPAPIGSGNLSSLEFVEKLVAHGANVNLRLKKGASGRGILSKVGATPFLLAAVTADVPLMRLLLELGADPTLPNAQHCTPLLAAAGVGTVAPGEEAGTEPEVLEAVALCLELGSDVNAVDDNGETAMHGAAYKSLPQVVQFLADKGAKIEVWNHKNKYGWTPLLIAEGHRVGNFKPSAGNHRRPSSRDARSRRNTADKTQLDHGRQELLIGRSCKRCAPGVTF